MVSFPLPLGLLMVAYFLGAGGAVFRPVGLRREAGPALATTLHRVMFL